MRFAVVLCVIAVSLAAAYEMDGDVIVGTDANFDDIVSQHEFVLAEFYAPWCGHCKSLAPEYAKAATAFKEQGKTNIALVKVDATEHKENAEKLGVKGYPTLKFYRNGSPSDYGGGRTADEIVSWISKRTGPAFATIASADEGKKFSDSGDVLVVGHFDDAESPAAAAFKTAAMGIDDIPFALTTDASFVEGAAANSVVLLKKFDDGNVAYTGDAVDAEALTAFVKTNSLPLAIEFTQESAPKIFGGDVKVHCLLFLKSGDDATLAEFRKTAAAKKGDALFVFMYAEKEDSKRIIEYFAVSESALPDVRLINLGGQEMTKYRMASKDKTEAAFSQFIEDYKSGSLKPFRMSEEPVEYSGKGVRTLTGGDHDSIAKDPSLNVLVEYYAPWCGHCKSLAPIYDELAAAFDGVENVVIAKMDSTANEVEGVSVQGFPTLKFYPAGDSGEVLDYEGGRELKPLKEYVLEKSQNLDAEKAKVIKDEL